MSHNPGLLFYKHYYAGFDFAQMSKDNDNKNADKKQVEKWHKAFFKKKNTAILETKFEPKLLIPIQFKRSNKEVVSSFQLTTTYPGLVIGTGYTHGIGATGEFKIGFFFDHTTGLPVIPGSSVKGLLRSAFPVLYNQKSEQLRRKKELDAADFWANLAQNRRAFIEALLNALGYVQDGKPDFVDRLEREIFEGLHGENREKAADHFPMSDRDVFYDALIAAPESMYIFEDEYITPHKNRDGDGLPDELKNPTPIQLLKIRPGVRFAFQFDLKANYRLIGREETPEIRKRLLTSDQRLELFRQILLFLGSGAKTNTGFGHFEASDRVGLNESDDKNIDGSQTTETEHKHQDEATKQPTAVKISQNLKYNNKLIGKDIIGLFIKLAGENKACFQVLNVEGFDKEIFITNQSVSSLKIGEKYNLKVTQSVPAKQILDAKISDLKPLPK